MAHTIDELRKVRLEKLEQIKKLGINPYPARCERKQTTAQALEMMGKEVAVSGRIMAIRGHGGIQFFDLRDESGKIQVVFKKDQLTTNNIQQRTKNLELLDLLDIGDFIDVRGEVFKTQAGEISVLASDFHLLTKSVRPLPSQWYGFKDIEERYRKRYLDLLMSPKSKEIFEVRSKIISAMREFLVKRGYYEVETPVLQPLYGGGLARPFKTYHNVLGIPLYLRISTELYLKRLIVGGFEKVFEFARLFRNEGIDKNHNPEFTMLETMEAYIDYKENMKLVEEMTEYAVKKASGKTKITYEGNEIEFKAPWKRLTMNEAVKQVTGIDFLALKSLEEALKAAQKIGIQLEVYHKQAIGLILAAAFEEKVEETLIQPTIIYDFPVETSPLAKRLETDPRLVERWEHFTAGIEMSNNYSELNDPVELGSRFGDERKKERLGNEEAHQTDDDFVEAMEYGMPPTSGIGPGIDRLTLIVCGELGAQNLRDVILFPIMKPTGVSLSDGVFGDKETKAVLPEIKPIETGIPQSLGITREKAINLLKKYLAEEKEFNHLYATEAAMDFYAKKFGGNVEAWKLAGLLHDLDWDYVNGDVQRHGKVSAEILKKEGVCEPVIYSILAHVGFPEYPRKTKMDSALWGSEELTGLILALAKGRPDKQVKNVTKETVLRAYKNPNFASGVNRAVIKGGAEELGVSLEEHVDNVLEAMQGKNPVSQESKTFQPGDVFYIDEEIKKKFPGMKVAVAIIEGVDVHRGSRELEKFKAEVLDQFAGMTIEQIDELPTIKAYRNIFKAFGVDWHSHHPSADALLRRVVLGKGLYNVNTLVDAYNLAVIDSKIALGAFDSQTLSLPVVLRLAKDGEEVNLLGEEETTKVKEGEMVYSDQSRIMTLDLNYRDCDYTKITTGTKNVVLFADGTPEISSEEVMEGLEKGIEYITKFCGGKRVKKFIVE